MNGTRVLAGITAAVLVLILLAPSGATPSIASPTHHGSITEVGSLPPSHNISYKSSVDNFSLSYLEWLPTGYVSTQTYPLAIFLHGIGSTTTWVSGGLGGLPDLKSAPNIVTYAQSEGFILISLNTRSSAGFYTNTPCGGPQQQDALDAITHEANLRHVGSLYLIGFSMGSMGAFSLAATHPGMFAGVATVGSITDAYEVFAENTVAHTVHTAWRSVMCLPQTALPGNATLDSLFAELSYPRSDPQLFTGTKLYVTVGAQDARAVNNFSVWPFAQGNSTFVNSSCHVATAENEPSGCTTTFASLAANNSTAYEYRFVWEANGIHSAVGLPAKDVYRFFLGLEGGGVFTATYPPTILTRIS